MTSVGSSVSVLTSIIASQANESELKGSQNTRKSFVGAPMAIQVVGRKGDDAAVCDAMEAIENAVRHIRTGAARETLALSRL